MKNYSISTNKNQQIKLFCLLFFSLFNWSVWSQTTLFSENMGSPSGTVTIAANTFQNNGSLTYSNGGQTNSADVRITSASSGYTGASGGGNIFFTSTSGAYGFSIEGINASNFNTLSLQFGYKKEAAASHATFAVEYWNGTSWVSIANTASALFNELASASAVWYLSKSLSLPTAAQINGLKIRFVKTGTTAIRIDDVKLIGTETLPEVTTALISNVTSTSALFGGKVTATGGSSIIATGTVYSVTTTNVNPTIGGIGVTNLQTSSPNAGTGTFTNVSGSLLSPNVQHSFAAYATKSTGLTGYGAVGSFYTLAVTPSAPIISSPTASSLNVTIGNDTNSSSTTYAMQETTSGNYVQADGLLGTSAVYQTKTAWGTKTVTGLASSTLFSFRVMAKNGENIITNLGPSADGTTATPSSSSDIFFNAGSTTSDNTNINYAQYQGTTLTSTTSGINGSVGVMGFYLRDGGAGLNDADNLPTELTAITFNVTNSASIRSARLFIGTSYKGVAIPVNGASTISFTNLTGIVADDNTQKAISLRITFNTNVTDNQQLQFTVVAATTASTGSKFAVSNAGGATSSIAGDINRIEVTADRLAFVQQPPTNLFAGTIMTPSPKVAARDGLENIDLDYTGIVMLTTSGNFNTTQTATAVAGVATFTYYVMDFFPTGINNILTASANNLNAATSDPFEVMASPALTITNIPIPTCTNNNTCNLVANGNFEQYNQLPTTYNGFDNYPCGWYIAYGTPDYFNAGTTSPNFSIPCNNIGAQTSNNNSGNGYTGCYFNNTATSQRQGEIMVSRLYTPLVAGQTYQLSFDVSLAEGMSSFSKTVQAYLSPTLITIPNFNIPLTLSNPQMLFSKNTTSTVADGWETLTFTFTSTTGGEEYIYLGGITGVISQPNPPASDSSCSYGNYNTPFWASSQYGYYYFDNVKLVPLNLDAVNDNFSSTPINSLAGGNSPSVYTNDTLNGIMVTSSSVQSSIVSVTPAISPMPTIDANGVITIPAGTAVGTYTIEYKIENKCDNTIFDTATATVVVAPDVYHPGKISFRFCYDSSNQYDSSISTIVQNHTSLFDLGTVGGLPANQNNATIQFLGFTTPNTPLVINPDGTFTITSSFPITNDKLWHQFYYKICSNGICSEPIRSDITIDNTIFAMPDTVTFYTTNNSLANINVLDDDFLGYFCSSPTIIPATPQNVILTQITPINFFYNISNIGDITYNQTAPVGVYDLEYKICDATFPNNCSNHLVRIYQCDPNQPLVSGNPCYQGNKMSSSSQNSFASTDVVIAPNPSRDNFEILFESKLFQNVTYEVYDILGKKVVESVIPKNTNTSIIDLNNYPQGLYLLRIFVGDIILNKKLIKQ